MRRLRLLLVLAMLVACRHGKQGDAYKIERISAQGARACATMKDGSVRCWGREGDKSVTSPALVAGAADASDVCVGDAFSCVLGRGGTVSCLGQNVQNATAIACGAAHVCAVSAGTVLCWNATSAPREISAGATTIADFSNRGVPRCPLSTRREATTQSATAGSTTIANAGRRTAKST